MTIVHVLTKVVAIISIAFPVGVALLGLAAASLPAQALEVVDDRGVTLHFARAPQRVVSMLPSLTESVCALDRCQRLVGVDRYSNFPENVKRLPEMGGGLDPNIEGIVALRPDVVLVATSSRASRRLESLGIAVVALEPKSHADVKRVLQTLGRLLGLPDAAAARLWRDIDDKLSASTQPRRRDAVDVHGGPDRPAGANEGLCRHHDVDGWPGVDHRL